MPHSTTDITHLWHQVSRAVHDRLRTAFRGSCLPPMALHLLRKIRQDPGLTVSELGRRSNLAKSYISRTTEQLVSLGYVEKRADEADQRLTRLHVTKTAHDIMTEMAEMAAEAWGEILADMPEEHVATLTAGLQHLLAALRDPGVGAGAASGDDAAEDDKELPLHD